MHQPASLGRLLLAAALLSLAAPAALHAQAAELPKKEITEKTGAVLSQLRPLLDAKNHAGALALVDPLLSAAAPGSYDAYVLSQIKAQILLTLNRLPEAIAPLETALRLGEGNPAFSDASARLEQLNLLAQLHYQRAVDIKDRAAQKAAYETALGHMRRWLAGTPRPTADARLFTASVLYQLATLDTAKADPALLRQALAEAREGQLLAVTPPAQLVLVLVACHLQLGENTAAAELLENLALRDPKSSSTWSQLQSIYLAQAAEAKDPAVIRSLNLRALHTLDRAQAAGHLAAARDHYTRVAILFNLQQFTRAAALLEKGLADGTLENSKRNWELLVSAYQQTERDELALSALDRATAKFPADGALEFSLAQFLYGTGKVAPAYERARSALAKGLEKPGQARVYLAYLAYELQRYDDASGWIDAARAGGDVPASTLDPLSSAIADAIKTRAAAAKS